MYFESLGITDVKRIGNINGLETLYLNNNLLDKINLVQNLPLSLLYISFENNLITTKGYTDSEVWANSQPSFTNNCNVYFSGNVDSVTGTNLKTILETKNCIVNA